MQTLEMVTPVEQDLLNTLRTFTENSGGKSPSKMGMTKEMMETLMKGASPTVDMPPPEKLEAAMKEVFEKHGGEEELRKKYGKDKKFPPEIMDEIREATEAMIQKHLQENKSEDTQKTMQKNMAIQQERVRGITFYTMLKPDNDPHYAGGAAKLGTPDRPILWYKPTGTDNYRVVYADLTVKDMTPAEAKELTDNQCSVPLTSNIVKSFTKIRDQREQAIPTER